VTITSPLLLVICYNFARIDIAYLCTKFDDFRFSRSSEMTGAPKIFNVSLVPKFWYDSWKWHSMTLLIITIQGRWIMALLCHYTRYTENNFCCLKLALSGWNADLSCSLNSTQTYKAQILLWGIIICSNYASSLVPITDCLRVARRRNQQRLSTGQPRWTYLFLPRDAMLAKYMLCPRVSPCLSAWLSQVGVLSKGET